MTTENENEKLQVELGRHWVIIGATGSGKTWFCKQLLNDFLALTYMQIPIYVIDSKLAGDFDSFVHRGLADVLVGNNIAKPFVPRRSTGWRKGVKPILIWQPESDNPNMYDAFFEMIYRARKPAIVYVDELSSITTSSGKPPHYYDILLKQGRGLGITMVSTTQSAAYIPPSLLRQATHLVKMHLNSPLDAKKLADVMGKEAYTEPLNPHGLWYRDLSKPVAKAPPVLYKDLKEFYGLP